MSCAYRNYPDFPKWSLPLRAWPDLARVMARISLFAPCDHEYISIIASQLSMVSIITDSLLLDSIIVDELEINSLIC